MKRFFARIALLFLIASSNATQASVGYYIGLDGLETITSGTYANLPNPNFGRLTYLYNHGDHFHGIGAYSLIGPASEPTIRDTNANNRIPETFSLQPPLPLSQGSGALYADKLVNKLSSLEYSDLHWNSMDALADADPSTEDGILFSSSGGRWTGSLTGMQIGLQLLAITPGLFVGDADTLNIFENGDIFALGDGGALDFLPVFWTALNTTPGTYSAEFRLVAFGSGGLRDSGRFSIDFAPVPVPGALWLLSSAFSVIFGMHRRQASFA